jgi:hypothetical protein
MMNADPRGPRGSEETRHERYCGRSLRLRHAVVDSPPMPVRALHGTLLIGTVVALLTTGCVTSAIALRPLQSLGPEVAAGRSVVEPGDAIVIVPSRAASCIGDSLRQVHPTLRIMSPDEFRRAAFQDQTPAETTFTYPIPEPQQKLLSTQIFRDRIAPLRLRYLVSIGEEEKSRDRGGLGSGPFFNWYRLLKLSASVFDLKDGREVGQIVVESEGERMFFIFGFIPIWYVETIRGPGCKRLGEGVGNFIAGREPASPITGTTDEPGSPTPRTIDK